MTPDKIKIPFRLAEKLTLLCIFAILPLTILSNMATKDYDTYSILLTIPVFLSLFLFWSGTLPGSIESISIDSFYINPRAEKYSWLYNLDASGIIKLPESKLFVTQSARFQIKEKSLTIFNEKEKVFICSGERVRPISEWLIRQGVPQHFQTD